MRNLTKIGIVLRKEEIDYLELLETIQDFKKIVLELSEIDMNNDDAKKDIHFDNGKAIGMTWAALCVDDLMRTKMFVKGLFVAIDSLLEKGKKPVHVLYAGTGPFATLILPILANYTKEEVQCTLIEINPLSLESAKRVIHKLDYDDYIVSYENADATQYVIDTKIPIDIVLSETMQCGLIKEQQVPIVINIMKQVKKDTILIPEMIAVDLCLMNKKKFMKRGQDDQESDCFLVLDRLIEISSKKLLEYTQKLERDSLKILFPEKSIAIYPEQTKDFETLVLLTRITIFGETKIEVNETGLTMLINIKSVPDLSEKRTLKSQYKIDNIPGFIHEWV